MKGPGLRVELDVRRIWECPACGRCDRFLGDVVSAQCSCRDGGVNMRLIEGRRQVRKFDVSRFQKPREQKLQDGEAGRSAPYPEDSPLEKVECGIPEDVRDLVSPPAGEPQTVALSSEAPVAPTVATPVKPPEV